MTATSAKVACDGALRRLWPNLERYHKLVCRRNARHDELCRRSGNAL